MKDQTQNNKTFPSLVELGNVVSRFAFRYLLLGMVKEDDVLMLWLTRADLWPFPNKDELVENLTNEFPNLTINKTFSLHQMIENEINPRDDVDKKPQQVGEKIPEVKKKVKKGPKAEMHD